MRATRHIIAIVLGAALFAVPVPASAAAGGPASRPAAGDVVRLWAGRAPRAAGDTPAETPNLTCFPPDPGTANGTAVVVCPGGGYAFLAMGDEGTDVARWLAGRGVFAAVLAYRINVPQPAPLLDGQRAVRLLRAHAADWGINPRRVGIVGFSAGGHVASSVATHWDTGIPKTGDPVQNESCRPDFMVLAYPVVTMRAGVTHPGSRRVLLGEHPPQKLVDAYSNELQVTAQTPPAFIVASRTDTIVPVKNSELLADALRRHKVPVALVELPTGDHGYGMAPGHPELAWTDKCLDWMRGRGLLTSGKENGAGGRPGSRGSGASTRPVGDRTKE